MEYKSKAKIKTIKFASRASVKLRDNFYTFEYGEERQIDNLDDVDISKEIQALTDYCNNVVDNQIEEITNMLLHKN